MTRCYWLSNKRMTVLAETEEGIIVFAAPIIRVYPAWADTKVGYQGVAATAKRHHPSPIERYFVHPVLIEMLIVF